ncbi:MAG: hypothetical protein QM667_09630 [Asticcacaulis sp.]
MTGLPPYDYQTPPSDFTGYGLNAVPPELVLWVGVPFGGVFTFSIPGLIAFLGECKDAIDKAAAVADFLQTVLKAAMGLRHDLMAGAYNAVIKVFRYLLGNNLTLAEDMEGFMKPLNDALAGVVEVEVVVSAGEELAAGGRAAPGAVVNIAINQGGAVEASAAQPSAVQTVHHQSGFGTGGLGRDTAYFQTKVTPGGLSTLWLAFQAFYEKLWGQGTLKVLLISARQQLLRGSK